MICQMNYQMQKHSTFYLPSSALKEAEHMGSSSGIGDLSESVKTVA